MTKPALTQAEWEDAFVHLPITSKSCLEFYVCGPEASHGTAAECLYGQPFGFTWEDVALLREEGSVGYPETGLRLRDLADRIEALLAPEEADDT